MLPDVQLTAYEPEDAWAITPTEHAAALNEHLPNLKAAYEFYKAKGPAWTLRINGVLIGCAGLMLLDWPGVAHAWMLPSPALAQHPKISLTLLRQKLEETIRTHQLVRIQAEVQTTFTTGRRFIESLGFEHEGDMRRFGPDGSTFSRYAWVRREP